MEHFIITGGLGAGKSNLVARLQKRGFIVGSPASTMKRSLAKALAEEWGGSWYGGTSDALFIEMLDQATKDRYRFLLQAYGEYFTNQDNSHWIDKVMTEVQQDLADYRYHLPGDDPSVESNWMLSEPLGTVYDSIRTPAEVRGVRKVFPDALHVRLDVSLTRQMVFLTKHLGRKLEDATKVLAHSSEHWLDDMAGTDYDANIRINADYGDEAVWAQFQGRVWPRVGAYAGL